MLRYDPNVFRGLQLRIADCGLRIGRAFGAWRSHAVAGEAPNRDNAAAVAMAPRRIEAKVKEDATLRSEMETLERRMFNVKI